MQPVKLTLKGFRGIRDGLGRDEITLDLECAAGDAQLVAIAGANGRGKTTVMDNLHPFPVMPSRAGADGLGSFSYYEHLYLAQNEKDLVWDHAGQRYRSHFVFWLNGRRRTEAYLMVWTGDRWQPAQLDDGTPSDGRRDSYERCVEQVLGSAETFFTSVFSAQGRRQLCAYRNAEIKRLLADLLGLDGIRELGQKAAETGRLLKTRLAADRQIHATLTQQIEGRRTIVQRLADAEERVLRTEAARAQAAMQLDAAKEALAVDKATCEQAAETEKRRAELNAERERVAGRARATQEALDLRECRERDRLASLERRIALRAGERREARRKLEARRQGALETTLAAPIVRRACRRLPLAQRVEALRGERFEEARRSLERLREVQQQAQSLAERLNSIEREAGQASLRAADLDRRFGLTRAVPCAGTGLQGRCQLLGDAHEAQALRPGAAAAIARLAAERCNVEEALAAARAAITGARDAPGALKDAQARLCLARERVARLLAACARRELLERAQTAVTELDVELAALAGSDDAPTDAETQERRDTEAALAAIAAERAQAQREAQAAFERIASACADLPSAFDVRRIAQAERRVTVAAATLQEVERAHLDALRDLRTRDAAAAQCRELEIESGQVAARMRRIEHETGYWVLLSKCLSNDGVIALEIDDAGPALAGLANELLLACYGPRFTVSIRTLVETGKGEAREGFDIVVHDGESGESKSVSLMSGGERVWINECLTRAIALYLAGSNGRRYQTLFSDELDGPLDAERKRMFMAMKREVLRLGGYAREYFISQTPELAAMADAVIDLDAMAAQPAVAGGA